jgi:KUP system potassium uptake protein
MHEEVVLVTVQTEHVPTVPDDDRVHVEVLDQGITRVVLHWGFMEEPNVPAGLRKALERLGRTSFKEPIVYLLGRETLIVSRKGRMDPVTEPIFAFLSRNVSGVTDSFAIPPEEVVEIGMQLDL